MERGGQPQGEGKADLIQNKSAENREEDKLHCTMGDAQTSARVSVPQSDGKDIHTRALTQ